MSYDLDRSILISSICSDYSASSRANLNMAANCTETFGLFHAFVQFCSNRQTIREDMSWLFSPFKVERQATSQIKIVHQSDSSVRIETTDTAEQFDSLWRALLFGVKARLLGLFWRSQTRPITLHGASVCRNGKAMLLIGPDGAGKTTLAILLGIRGFDVYSDEYGILDPRNMMVWPYPAPIAVRPPTLDQLDLAPLIKPHLFEVNIWDREHQDEKKFLIPPTIHSNPKPCSLGHIVLLDESIGDDIQLSSLKADRLIELLLEQPKGNGCYYLHSDIGGDISATTIKSLKDRLNQIVITKVTRGPCRDMVEALERLF